jgi:predicted dehydrogenase/mannose-6-phosphate isomerase-like protein (cupin superfamily)
MTPLSSTPATGTAFAGGPLGLGIVGAGRFAAFLLDAVADLPQVRVRVVADEVVERATALAAAHGARATSDWGDLLMDDAVDVVMVATPPDSHARIAIAALDAGRHVFCEKPLATTARDAADVVAAAERAERVLVVDHVLRYNPIVAALLRLKGPLLGPVTRFSFENDASDEDLPPEHWFWKESVSGGIFVEHGVHFFDAANLLIGSLPTAVRASTARRPDPYALPDLVSATCEHPGGVLAGHTHGFTHAHRCERQLMRLDHGCAQAQVQGWIPVDAAIDAWTDDDGAELADELAAGGVELLGVNGFRLGPRAGVTVEVTRDAGASSARGRGIRLHIPHHVSIGLTLGGAQAKAGVYRESVRTAMADLAGCVATGATPASGGRHALDAVEVATAARRAAAEGRTVSLHFTTTAPGREHPSVAAPTPDVVERVEKPWGHEEIFALVEGVYCGKLLYVRGGESLSLQYHERKEETLSLLSGDVELDLGGTVENLRRVGLAVGESIHVPPGTVHRIRAVRDCVLVEASSAAPGWRSDVVRLDDRYGRDGTSAP